MSNTLLTALALTLCLSGLGGGCFSGVDSGLPISVGMGLKAGMVLM